MGSRRRRLSALALLVALLLGACGDDDDASDPDAQPSPDVTTFGEGDFSDIPLPPLAEEAGERSERDGVVVQSFFVRNRTPEDVLDFYRTYFEGEGGTPILAPEPYGNQAWRGTWLVDDRELLVSAIPAPSVDGTEVERADVVTQMSLELSPA